MAFALVFIFPYGRDVFGLILGYYTGDKISAYNHAEKSFNEFSDGIMY